MTVPLLRSEGSGCHMSLISVGELLAIASWGGAFGTVGCNVKVTNSRMDPVTQLGGPDEQGSIFF